MVAAELDVEDEVERCVRVGSASWVAVELPFDIVGLDIIWVFVRVCFSIWLAVPFTTNQLQISLKGRTSPFQSTIRRSDSLLV